MTNEQLAMYVKMIVGRLRSLEREIVSLDGERESVRVWVGPTAEPSLTVADILRPSSSPALDRENWRIEPGRPMACVLVEALADELAEQAEELLRGAS